MVRTAGINLRNCTQEELVFLPATCESIIEMTRQISWLIRMDPQKRLLTGRTYQNGKRLMDLVIILAAAPFLAVLVGLCALLIKLDDPHGPVFFQQERTGKNGKRFLMLKFRTMVHDAEELKVRYRALNELHWPDFKITDDPRITQVGRFLRRTSLDELPQLLNILKGEMSLVGPRPTSFPLETYELWQTERLDVVPGLTGLWQILGRGSMEFCERVCLDIVYIERRCLALDFMIILHTFLAVIEQKGA
jgi:lipopolysaccharide/colanic/teichoic acid biosynthesis glycosyltransferase